MKRTLKGVELGTDVGGVLYDDLHIPHGSRDSLHNPDPMARGYLNTQRVPGAYEILARARQEGAIIRVVSRVDPHPERLYEMRIREVVPHIGFGELIPDERVHVVERREQKVTACVLRKVRIFVDNRLQCLVPMIGLVEELYLLCRTTEIQAPDVWQYVEDGSVKLARSWQELGHMLFL